MNRISIDELKGMTGQEGLILQGCGGDPQEWIDGINELLTSEGILLGGSKFENVLVFQHNDHTNLLFHMDDTVKLDMGKLAMWRLMSHGSFGGIWLSDFLINRLGIESEQQIRMDEKPESPLLGADGNIFALLGIASRTLKHCGMYDEAKEMHTRVTKSGGYNAALAIILEYVTPVDAENRQSDDFTMEIE